VEGALQFSKYFVEKCGISMDILVTSTTQDLVKLYCLRETCTKSSTLICLRQICLRLVLLNPDLNHSVVVMYLSSQEGGDTHSCQACQDLTKQYTFERNTYEDGRGCSVMPVFHLRKVKKNMVMMSLLPYIDLCLIM
jgi:hypothetical protein